MFGFSSPHYFFRENCQEPNVRVFMITYVSLERINVFIACDGDEFYRVAPCSREKSKPKDPAVFHIPKCFEDVTGYKLIYGGTLEEHPQFMAEGHKLGDTEIQIIRTVISDWLEAARD